MEKEQNVAEFREHFLFKHKTAKQKCVFCDYFPVENRAVTIHCPKDSYHCPECKRSYWIPRRKDR